MVNRDIIKTTKQSTLAVGLVELGKPRPIKICGSGFIIDNNGVIATAFHVLEACKKSKEYFKNEKGIDTAPAIFRVINSEQGLSVDSAVIDDLKQITLVQKSSHFPIQEIDLGFGKMKDPIPECVPLVIASSSLQVLDEIGICGFPSGSHSFNMDGEKIGIRLSPTFQMGKVSGLLPFDESPDPYGIQTDVIGVGGSSGSPILDNNDGKVIGIAQNVLPGGAKVDVMIDKITKKVVQGYGIAIVGQIYGVTHNVLNPIFTSVLKYYREGIIEGISIHVTGLEFKQPLSNEN